MGSEPFDGVLIMPNGKYEGYPITRVPFSYLKWMVSIRHSYYSFALKEIDRRGSSVPDLDVTNHAIDRASLRLLRVWKAARKHSNDGLASWLSRVAFRAFKDGIPTPRPAKHLDHNTGESYNFCGMFFVFAKEAEFPVLMTVGLDGEVSAAVNQLRKLKEPKKKKVRHDTTRNQNHP